MKTYILYIWPIKGSPEWTTFEADNTVHAMRLVANGDYINIKAFYLAELKPGDNGWCELCKSPTDFCQC